jgi:pimeloyl-ACP methyl ester carboxylesterase
VKRLVICGLLGLGLVIVVAIAGALGYRAWRQAENARTSAIRAPNGIQEARFVRLGGVDQWVQIRGEDRNNPVLLYVHGGPGVAVSPFVELLRPWERDFTVVTWDQRCAGKTYARNGDCVGMSLEQVAKDGVELSERLRARLHKRNIVLLGHSWGSMVALHMAHDRPDLYSAYVGTGQVISIAEKEPIDYQRALARARAAKDQDGVRALEALGPPPYRKFQDLMVERNVSLRHDSPAERGLEGKLIGVGLFAPGWSLWDAYQYFQAGDLAEAATFQDAASYDARALGLKFAIPVFVFNGADDNVTPAALAEAWFDQIEAPQKGFVALPGAGHAAVVTEPEVFLRELVTRVRPLAE